MFLLIDTSEYNQINLAVFDSIQIVFKEFSGQNRELLECIHKVVNSCKSIKSIKSPPKADPPWAEKVKSLKDLKGIMVVVGTGGFTSTRIACVVANTFAYVLQIPLLAIKKTDVQKVQKLIPKLLKQKPGHYLSATYSGEPNLGNK